MIKLFSRFWTWLLLPKIHASPPKEYRPSKTEDEWYEAWKFCFAEAEKLKDSELEYKKIMTFEEAKKRYGEYPGFKKIEEKYAEENKLDCS